MREYLKNLWEFKGNNDSLMSIYHAISESLKAVKDRTNYIEYTDIAGIVSFWNEFTDTKGYRKTLERFTSTDNPTYICRKIIDLFPTTNGTKELLDFWEELIKEDSVFSKQILSILIAYDVSEEKVNVSEDFKNFKVNAMNSYAKLSGDSALDFYNLASEDVMKDYLKTAPAIQKYDFMDSLSKEIDLLNENKIIKGILPVTVSTLLEKFSDEIKQEVKSNPSLISKENWLFSVLLLNIDHTPELLSKIIDIEPNFLNNKSLIAEDNNQSSEYLISKNYNLFYSLLLHKLQSPDNVYLKNTIYSLGNPLTSDQMEKIGREYLLKNKKKASDYLCINFCPLLYYSQLSVLSDNYHKKDKKEVINFFNDFLNNDFHLYSVFGKDPDNKYGEKNNRYDLTNDCCIRILNFVNYLKDELSEKSQESLKDLKKFVAEIVWKHDFEREKRSSQGNHFNVMLACLSEENIPFIQDLILTNSQENLIELVKSCEMNNKFINNKNCESKNWSVYARGSISIKHTLSTINDTEEVFKFRENLLYLMLSNPKVTEKFNGIKSTFVINAIKNNQEAFVCLLGKSRNEFIDMMAKNKKITKLTTSFIPKYAANAMNSFILNATKKPEAKLDISPIDKIVEFKL